MDEQTREPVEGSKAWYEQKEAIAKAKLLIRGAVETNVDEPVLTLEKEAKGSAQEVGYAARLLVQATLPHSKPETGIYEFERSNGYVTLKITADKSCGLPFGTYPRLLLAWIATEAVRTKSPHIELGKSFNAFMTKLGIAAGGGPRGSATRLRDHMQRLFSATVSATYQRNGEWCRMAFCPIEQASMFWDPKQPEQIGIWNSQISLNQRFFEEITHKPVPVDMHALKMLSKSRSPMALDIYQWLTHRLSYLREATTVPWAALQLQFGGDYKLVRQFKAKFIGHLKEVLKFYHQAKVEPTQQGLLIRPSKTHVPMRLICTK